jgi:hypothetical protein
VITVKTTLRLLDEDPDGWRGGVDCVGGFRHEPLVVQVAVYGGQISLNGRLLGWFDGWRLRRGMARWSDRTVTRYLTQKIETEYAKATGLLD